MNARITDKHQLDIGSVIVPSDDVLMQGTETKTFTGGKCYEVISSILGKSDKHTLFIVRNDFGETHALPLPFIEKKFQLKVSA